MVVACRRLRAVLSSVVIAPSALRLLPIAIDRRSQRVQSNPPDALSSFRTPGALRYCDSNGSAV